MRIKARLICTKVIEKLTNTNLVIYGKTVSIIGRHEDVINAKEAVKYLLEGAPHGNVYNFLEGAVSKRK